MYQLEVRDNSEYPKEDFSEIASLTERIADKTLEELEREGLFVFPEILKDSEDLSKDQMVLQSVNGFYRTSNVMGFLGCEEERLVIQSRFGGENEDYFFQYLLSKVLGFVNIVDLDTDSSQEHQMFSLLLFLFPHYLKKALRKGIYKEYIRRQYSDSNVKGTVDIARHIKENTPFTGKVAYSQREFSYDNDLMELIRHTIEYLKGKPYGKRLLAKVKDEVKQVVDATDAYKMTDRRKIMDRNRKNPVRHAYFHEYLALQRLCLLILGHQMHQIGTGTRQIYGIVFDGAWLWEEYINLLLKDKFHHPQNKSRSGGQRLFERNTGIIYPDFISRDKEKRIIADAKYKPAENIGNRDYLQILAYMFRFDAEQGYYLYPESREEQSAVLRMNRGTTFDGDAEPRENIKIMKHGLCIPADSTDYESFIAEMKVQEQAFLRPFFSQKT